jgi:hypothetical protein
MYSTLKLLAELIRLYCGAVPPASEGPWYHDFGRPEESVS